MFYKYAPNRRIMVVNGHDSQRTWQLWHKTTTYSLYFVHILPNALLHHFLFFHFNENTTRGLWKKCNIGQILLWNVIIILLISWITVKMGYLFPFLLHCSQRESDKPIWPLSSISKNYLNLSLLPRTDSIVTPPKILNPFSIFVPYKVR